MIKEEKDMWICKQEEANYPQRLKYFENMPEKLFVKGKLPDENKKSVAIVGARSCSYYGRTQAYEFA